MVLVGRARSTSCRKHLEAVNTVCRRFCAVEVSARGHDRSVSHERRDSHPLPGPAALYGSRLHVSLPLSRRAPTHPAQGGDQEAGGEGGRGVLPGPREEKVLPQLLQQGQEAHGPPHHPGQDQQLRVSGCGWLIGWSVGWLILVGGDPCCCPQMGEMKSTTSTTGGVRCVCLVRGLVFLRWSEPAFRANRSVAPARTRG